MRLSRLAAFCTALAVLAAAGAAYVFTTRGDTARARPRPPAAAAPAPRAAVLASLAPAGAPTTPTRAGLARALAGPLTDRAFAGSISGLVVDAATGSALFDDGADLPFAPASTEKLLTAAAALTALGPDATLSTATVRAGSTVYLVGGGDVTLTAARRAGYPPTATLGDLAARTARTLTGTGPVTVAVDTTAWTGPSSAPGWKRAYFVDGDIAPPSPLEVDEGRLVPGQQSRTPTPALDAGRRFAAALRAHGVSVAGTVNAAAAPESARPLATVRSAPVSALVQRMLTVSDNDLAEALGRAVAAHDHAPPDFSGAASAITARVRALGVPMQGVRLYDASGLSRLDRVTARALVAVLAAAGRPGRPELRPLLEGLPVAGLTGTLADRYRGRLAGLAAGDVRAKTGTLLGVSTLAGQVVDADGRLLLFAFLTGRASSPEQAEPALDRLATRLAGCGCRAG